MCRVACLIGDLSVFGADHSGFPESRAGTSPPSRCRSIASGRGENTLIHIEPTTILIQTLDLIGTFVFALSGALLGVRHGMDLFGVLV
ncbi:MAG: TRIC cation channel family protein, partial [Rhodopila sp.]|nr:TRIC cation channel family protein [Rhodopila sp.]